MLKKEANNLSGRKWPLFKFRGIPDWKTSHILCRDSFSKENQPSAQRWDTYMSWNEGQRSLYIRESKIRMVII